MKPEQAIEILIKAVQVAQSKGAFGLNDAKVIAEAVETFLKKPEEPKVEEPAKEEVK